MPIQYTKNLNPGGFAALYVTFQWCILGDPGAVSRVDKMFVVKVYSKIQ